MHTILQFTSRHWDVIRDVAMLGITAAGVAAAIGVLVVYLFQLDAMTKSNRITREALTSVQRAFVTFSPYTSNTFFVNEGTKKPVSVQIAVPMENSGVTPKRGMLNHVNLYITPTKEPLPDDFTYPDVGDLTEIPVTFGPKVTLYSRAVGPVPWETVEAVQKRDRHLYIYGWATYRDIFDQTPMHVTKFCYELSSVNDLGDHRYSLVFVLHRQHNCTDEECAKQPQPN